MTLEKTQSNALYVVKCFAILSVITAHMSFTSEYFIAETVRNCLGQIGVVVFFVLSGFFYKRYDGDTRSFWSKKVRTTILPWVVLSTATYALSIILGGGIKDFPLSFIKNFLGFGSLYWYMSISIVLYAVFKFITKKWQLVSCIIISIVSIGLTVFEIIPHLEYFNQYLNPLNWIGFFAFGIILRQEGLMERLVNLKLLVVSLVVLIVSVIFAVVNGNDIKAYMDITSLFTEVFGFIVALNISSYLANNKLLIDIGKKSFFIYLMHIQVAGFINTRLPYNTLFFILRPFIVLAICYVVAIIFKRLLKSVKLSKYSFVFGLDR